MIILRRQTEAGKCPTVELHAEVCVHDQVGDAEVAALDIEFLRAGRNALRGWCRAIQ
jgi:hypothetical protein